MEVGFSKVELSSGIDDMMGGGEERVELKPKLETVSQQVSFRFPTRQYIHYLIISIVLGVFFVLSGIRRIKSLTS